MENGVAVFLEVDETDKALIWMYKIRDYWITEAAFIPTTMKM